MKKSLFNTVMALCIGLFASCSQEEIISQTANGEVEAVSIDAQLPNLAHTRALPGAEANHQLRCILEVWDKAEGGKLITRIEKLASAANPEGKLQFSFTVPATTNYQCLLWADFIASDATATGEGSNTTYADKYFDTSNLKAIDFKVADASLFNNVSTDAFCGNVSKNGTSSQLSVTLKRPFTKVTLIDKSDYIKECKGLEVEYLTPSGYNIGDGTTSKTKAVTATGLTPTDKTWFSTFIFASADKQKLDQDITMNVTKTDGATEKKTIKKDQISLDSNVENNAEANFSADANVNIDVDVDPEFPDPSTLKIGQFVNKDGSVSDTYDAANAIAIVFAAAKGKTDTSNYGEAFTSKTIAGYAMALSCIGRTNNTTTYTVTPTGNDPYAATDYNGYNYTTTILASEGAASYTTFINFATWKEANTFTGANLSGWYIPSARQLLDMAGVLMGYTDATESGLSITKNTAFATAYEASLPAESAGYGWTNGTSDTNFMSSYMKGASVECVQLNADGKSIKLLIAPAKTNAAFAIRPVLTIFK